MAEIGEMVVQVAEASEASPEELAQQLRRFENNIFQPDPDKEAIRQEANELFPALTRCFFPQESTGQEEVCEQITAAGIEAVLRKTPLSVYMTVLGGHHAICCSYSSRSKQAGRNSRYFGSQPSK